MDSQLSGLVRTRHSERSFPGIGAEHSDRRVSTITIMKFHPIVNGSKQFRFGGEIMPVVVFVFESGA